MERKCHVSNESVLVSLSLRSSTAESVLVSLSLRSEEVLDGRVSSRLSLAAVRRRLSQFSSLSRCGPKKFSTAESVLVSLSLRSEEVLDGRVSYRLSRCSVTPPAFSRLPRLPLHSLWSRKGFFLPGHVSYGAGATASYQTLYLSDERYDHSK